MSERNPANDQAGRNKGRDLPVVQSAFVEAGIDLGFRPEESGQPRLCNAILNGAIPGNGVPQTFRIAGGKRASRRRSESELTEALSDCKRGSNNGTAASVCVLARWNRASHKRGHNRIAMLLVARVEPVLRQKGGVAKTVRCTIGTIEEWRNIEDELSVPFGNQFQRFAIPVVPDGEALGVVLMNEVAANLLF